MDLSQLKKEIPYQWRVQSFSKFKPQASCVAYIDARDVMNLLDEVCGPENWQSDYKQVNGNVYAGIGIWINERWVWKWDAGTETKVEKEKGEASDSFKRAAVKWGIGRFLYDLDIQYIPANEKKTQQNFPYPVDEKGNRVWDITKYINDRLPHKLVTTKTESKEDYICPSCDAIAKKVSGVNKGKKFAGLKCTDNPEHKWNSTASEYKNAKPFNYKDHPVNI